MSSDDDAVLLGELLAALGRDVVNSPRQAASAPVRGVTLHLPDDPIPDPESFVLWPRANEPIPHCAAIGVRHSDAEHVREQVGPDVAVIELSDRLRWVDAYDALRAHLHGHASQRAEHDLFAIADALAATVGGAVAIEDAERRVLAFSTVPGQPIDEVRREGILVRQVPEHVEREEWYRRLWAASGVVEFDAGPDSWSRVALAVRVEGDAIGSLWVVGTRQSLHDGADDALERAAPAIASALVRSQRTGLRSRERRAQLVRELLADGQLPDDVTTDGVVVGVRLGGTGRDADLHRMRLADVLSLQAVRGEGMGLAAAVDDMVYAVLPAADQERLRSQLVALLRRTAWKRARVAVSRPITGGSEAVQARQDVDALLRLMQRQRGSGVRVAFAADAGDQILLLDLADALAGAGRRHTGVVEQIAAYDREHGTHYGESLSAWFQTGGDAAAAAAFLHVHVNTLRYRHQRAVSIFGLRLDDPDARLLLHLQLRLRSLT